MFSKFINKFESEEQRAEAKVKIAQMTAQQKKFEERKRALEEELRRRKEEEAEMERMLQEQIVEEEISKQAEVEQQKLQQQELIDNLKKQNEGITAAAETKKAKKTRKKKKQTLAQVSPQTEDLPQLKIGFLEFSDNKNKFENLQRESEPSPEAKQQIKVNKLTVNPFLQNLKNEDKNEQKASSVKVSKLKKNSFMKQLEQAPTESQVPVPKKKPAEVHKKSQPEIKFSSKKPSIDNTKKDAEEQSSMAINTSNRNNEQTNNADKREKKNSSTFSVFIDNTKEFFRNSKEKLYKLSKEALNDIDDSCREDEKSKTHKMSTSEMQNYLLSHVLFDKPENNESKSKDTSSTKASKDNDTNDYLDKEYRDKIEQYCSLVEDKRPKKKKSKTKTSKEDKLPQIKMVEVKSIQEQLKHKLDQPSEKRAVFDELENLGTSRVKQIRDNWRTENVVDAQQDPKVPKAKKMNSNILDKIKSLEKAEEERLQRERENEERIKKLLENELLRQQQRSQSNTNDTEIMEEVMQDDKEEDEMKQDIWLRLEEELDNLEEEQKELETTEKMLIEEEQNIKNDDELFEEEEENGIKEIKKEIIERKKHSEQRKKVLQKFQHIFEKDDDTAESDRHEKIGSIHHKIETFLQVPDQENKKKFEDKALTGVSDIMSRVKNKLETQSDEKSVLYRPEARKLNHAALIFETKTESPHVPETPKPEQREWAWKSKTAKELNDEIMPAKPAPEPDSLKHRERKKGIHDLKFSEMLNDINSVKERMKERDINRENENKMQEMNRFMDEIQDSLRGIDDEMIIEKKDEEKPRKARKKSSKTKSQEKDKAGKRELIQNIKSELLHGSERYKTVPKVSNTAETNVSVNSIKQTLVQADLEETSKPSRSVQKVGSSLVSKLAEMLAPEEKSDTATLTKAPKVLLRNTSLENEDEKPKKTLEELKIEQQNKKWAWKEKDMKDLQEYIDSYDGVVPTSLKKQQRNLKDLEEELNIVESLIDNKETDIIVQIRSEKEKEFNSFMDGVKSYLNEDTKTSEEDDFKQGMQTYLDLIDNNKTDVKTYKAPQLKTNTLEKLKTKLFSDDGKKPENTKPSPLISKLPSSILEAATNPQAVETVKQVALDVKGNQTSLVKSFFEANIETSSPVIKSKGIHPTVLNLKNSNSELGRKKLTSQLQYKQKTILEVQQYIEKHEDLCVPTLIETIHKFSLSKREEDRLSMYKKFIDHAHQFIEQIGRSEEQQIFKDNIQSYLSVIENTDIKINATPKLKKHTSVGVPLNSNNKKKEIEKTSKDTKILSPEEKRKNILQKYGFRDHLELSKISDGSDSEDLNDDAEDDVKDLTDNELCLKYGLPPIEFPAEKKVKKVSVAGFKGLLSKIKQASSFNEIENEPSDNNKQLPSTSRIKSMFENRNHETPPSPLIERKNFGLNDKFKKRFENNSPSPDHPRKFERNSLQKSSTISNIGSIFEKLDDIDSDGSESPLLARERFVPLEKSRSFSKFKNAFETGVGINEDNENDNAGTFEKRKVNAELEALKSSKKMQKMFRINRSLSDAERSPRLDRELDDKTLQEVSRSRSAITDMFEASAPKVTFGGARPKQEKEKQKPKQAKPASTEDGRKWVFDTIQKYFDVIVEEDKEEEDDEDVEESGAGQTDNDYNSEEDSDNDDYTSAEEDLPEPPQIQPKVGTKNKIDVSSFFKEKPASKQPSTGVISKYQFKNSPILVQRSLAEKPMSQFSGPRVSSNLPQSPLAAPRSAVPPKRKVSIDDFVNDAAKQFDEMTDDSSNSINNLGRGESCRNLNQLSKSNSSSKIRGLFQTVVHGSASNLNISTFKSNLLRHLSNSRPNLSRPSSVNLDPGVMDDSSSEFSEYDD